MRTFLILLYFWTLGTYAHAAPMATELRFRAAARAHIAKELDAGRHQKLAVQALDSLMGKAHARLRGEGFGELADDLEGQWLGTYRKKFAGSYDMGSHAPASDWVAAWYASVEDALGVKTCEALHLKDIFVINFGWPVVMNPHAEAPWCLETLAAEPGDTCGAEYGRHFTGTKWQQLPDPYADPVTHWGVIPVVSWWFTEVACEVGLFGSDGSFLCGTAASAVEIVVARYVAPPVAGKIWDRANP